MWINNVVVKPCRGLVLVFRRVGGRADGDRAFACEASFRRPGPHESEGAVAQLDDASTQPLADLHPAPGAALGGRDADDPGRCCVRGAGEDRLEVGEGVGDRRGLCHHEKRETSGRGAEAVTDARSRSDNGSGLLVVDDLEVRIVRQGGEKVRT